MNNKGIEQLSLNAWPAQYHLFHDGWVLRFAQGYTKRSNSVQAFDSGGEEEGLEAKIDYCERMYAQAGLDPIFKITPFITEGLELALMDRGYELLEPSHVRILEDLQTIKKPTCSEVHVEKEVTETWSATMCSFGALTPARADLSRNMLSCSPLTKGFFTLFVDAAPVACGLGIVEKGYLGLYDIVTHPEHRGRGYGEQMILHMLVWAKSQGAEKSYLQVVQNNVAANKLYDKLNYKILYAYWYRRKGLHT
ncbi:GNAT family N-acetyltransferase [Paenibacillus turpanensis]|uniref:GNAT family N-acetyltransferase n=1 Tax=Paenibacillus turpanensis TaxID=2689078 RepID=UPI0014078602|nr:GNAT family N-acetyltransferase [Paenibacillus turpanensis]